jgi:adenine-specific DNA methylase
MGQQLIAVVSTTSRTRGERYRAATEHDLSAFRSVSDDGLLVRSATTMPDEPFTPDRQSKNWRGPSAVVRYGIDTHGTLFGPRQQLRLTTFSSLVRQADDHIATHDRRRIKQVKDESTPDSQWELCHTFL